MTDIAIVLALIVVNALARFAYLKWRSGEGGLRARKATTDARYAVMQYPLHPAPAAWSLTPESEAGLAAIYLSGVDW